MKFPSPILATMLLGISLIPNVALSAETPQGQSIKCQQLKQQLATLKSKIKVGAKASNGRIEHYVFSGLVGTQISNQGHKTVNSKFRHLSNEYAQKCSK